MRILYVLKNMRVDSGVNTALTTIANVLTEQGHDVFLASLSGLGPLSHRLALPSDRIISLAPGASFVLTAAKLHRLVRKLKVDVVHSHLYEPSVLARIATMGTRAASVMTEHSTFFPHLRWHHSFLDSVLARYRTDGVIAVSRSVAATFASRTGIYPTAIRVIPNAVTTSRGLAADRQTSFSAIHEANILLAGRLEFEKNIGLAVDIVRQLQATGRSVTLHVAGSGTLKSLLERLANERLTTGSVKFHGVVENMAELMTSMDALLLCSHWEGCPMVVLEAYALGVPVVATAVPGSIDIVDDRVSGLLFEPDNPSSGAERIHELLSNPALRKEIVANGLVKARQFDAVTTAAKHIDCYRHALKRRLLAA